MTTIRLMDGREKCAVVETCQNAPRFVVATIEKELSISDEDYTFNGYRIKERDECDFVVYSEKAVEDVKRFFRIINEVNESCEEDRTPGVIY